MRPVALLAVGWALACRPQFVEVDGTEFAFGSYVRIRVLAEARAVAETALARAFAEVHRLDTLWSAFLPTSEVAGVNRNRGQAVRAETRELVDRALDVCREVDGALDVTILPVAEAWGFRDERYRVPDPAELAAALEPVDFRQVELSGDSLWLTGAAQLDLGAVAVGAAVDRAVGLLKEAGAKEGLVDAGGDIRVFGDRVWRIGIQNPRGRGVIRVHQLRDRAVSTSGDYQKYFERDGRRYHHIFDPRTGYPADGRTSVTVFAPTAFEADAYATAAFVLGPQAAEDVFVLHPDIGAVFLEEDDGSLREVTVGRIE
ncbi:MAG: FAD:protein FMN transferase [candidate division WOR-3 bacterium]|nr:MAG: FAD:protein FMN transferase [candidate division WOR-3 bacterium]